jgi:hypothetical protein
MKIGSVVQSVPFFRSRDLAQERHD